MACSNKQVSLVDSIDQIAEGFFHHIQCSSMGCIISHGAFSRSCVTWNFASLLLPENGLQPWPANFADSDIQASSLTLNLKSNGFQSRQQLNNQRCPQWVWVWLCQVWLCCDQNLNTPFRSQSENGVVGVVMLKMVWLCSSP